MQALIDFLIRNILALWPFAVIEFNERGLRVRMGKAIEELEPGLHWRWLFVEKITSAIVTEDFIDLPFGDGHTRDGRIVTFSANIGFKVVSPMRMWQRVYDIDENLSRLAIGKLSTLIGRKTFDELAKGNESVRTWLKEQLDKETNDWGIEVTRVFITNLSSARMIRLLKDEVSHA